MNPEDVKHDIKIIEKRVGSWMSYPEMISIIKHLIMIVMQILENEETND